MPVLLLLRHAVKFCIINVDFFLLPKKYNRLSPYLVYGFLCQISPYLLCYPVGVYIYGPETAVPRHILQKIIGIRGAEKYALSLEGFNVVSVCGSVGILALCGKLLDRFHLMSLQCRQLRHFDNPEALYLLVGLLSLHRSQGIRKPFLPQLFQKRAFPTALRADQNQHVIILYARHKYPRHCGYKCLLRDLSGVSAVLCPLIFNQQRFQSGYTIPNKPFQIIPDRMVAVFVGNQCPCVLNRRFSFDLVNLLHVMPQSCIVRICPVSFLFLFFPWRFAKYPVFFRKFIFTDFSL